MQWIVKKDKTSIHYIKGVMLCLLFLFFLNKQGFVAKRKTLAFEEYEL